MNAVVMNFVGGGGEVKGGGREHQVDRFGVLCISSISHISLMDNTSIHKRGCYS
jgi:hypothetical protein